MGLPAFASALATAGPKILRPKKFIYNIVTENNFQSLWWLLAGRPMGDMLKGGSEVRERAKFSVGSQAGYYDSATQEFAPSISEDGDWLTAYWYTHMAHESWKEEELLINAGGVTEGDLIEETYKQEIYSKLQSLTTALHRSIAYAMWQTPNKLTMGSANGLQPYSIPCYVNEATSGLFAQGSSNGGTWTTIHGIDPTVTTAYKPYQGTYANAFPINNSGLITDATKLANNLIGQIEMAIEKTSFAPPPVDKQYFDDINETMFDKSGGAIFCSLKGKQQARLAYLGSQNRWEDQNDPWNNPRCNSVPFVYESLLDKMPLYLNTAGTFVGNEDGTSGVTPDNTGPRYYGINAKRMKMYFHRKRFLEWLEPFRRGLTTWQQGVNTLATMMCPDRSKHFIVSPSTDL